MTSEKDTYAVLLVFLFPILCFGCGFDPVSFDTFMCYLEICGRNIYHVNFVLILFKVWSFIECCFIFTLNW